jgi:hypothetical protein
LGKTEFLVMQYTKKTARKEHICTKCKKIIAKGEEYFSEERFLASLNKNQTKLCKECYQK